MIELYLEILELQILEGLLKALSFCFFQFFSSKMYLGYSDIQLLFILILFLFFFFFFFLMFWIWFVEMAEFR
jgi:hypothetical protein